MPDALADGRYFLEHYPGALQGWLVKELVDHIDVQAETIVALTVARDRLRAAAQDFMDAVFAANLTSTAATTPEAWHRVYATKDALNAAMAGVEPPSASTPPGPTHPPDAESDRG